MDMEKLRGQLRYQGFLLGGVAMLTGGALAVVSHVTEADIRAAEAMDLKQSLSQVLPGKYDNDLLSDSLTLPSPTGDVQVYRARQGGKIAAVVYRVTGQGYAGAIVCVLGVSSTGRVLGVRIVKHTETPGLGDKIELSKSNWLHRFENKMLGDPPLAQWGVKKDGGVFDQMAGATITPRAVVKAVKGGMVFFEQNRSRLLTP